MIIRMEVYLVFSILLRVLFPLKYYLLIRFQKKFTPHKNNIQWQNVKDTFYYSNQ